MKEWKLPEGIGKPPTPEPEAPWTEHEHQVAVVSWFRKTYPGVRIIAIPNGGMRPKRKDGGPSAESARLKAEGVVPGVPDLFIPAWKTFVEMKKPGSGRLTEAQADWLAYLECAGYRAAVCYGADEAKLVIAEVAQDYA